MIIKGNKVNLTPFRISDIKNKNYISWLNNKKLLKYSNQRFENNTPAKLKEYYLSTKSNKDFFYKILTKDKVFIGTIFCKVDKYHNTGNLGILIGNKNFSSSGFGFDAWVTLIKYLKKKVKVRKIYAGTLTCNKPMLKIFIKSKMKFEAKFKRQEVVNKKFYDLIIYSTFIK